MGWHYPTARTDSQCLSSAGNSGNATFDAAHSAAGKLKAIPEAMWIWTEALRLRGANS
jgi:hypothetical protein